ncbi:MAG TPA: cation:dicarboxylase symporter family transporter, partial [Steroidobacteraceae bacterium]
MAADIDNRLSNRILWGLLIGAAAGGATLALSGAFPGLLQAARSFSTYVLDPLGQVFLRMLFFVVIPLVFASLAMGVAQLERLGQLGPLAIRTFALFFLNMSIAVALGLVMMNVLEPGSAMDAESRASLLQEYGGAAQEQIATHAAQPEITPMSVVEMFMPRNLFGAFIGNDRGRLGDVLPLILFAILVGAAAIKLSPERRDSLRSGLSLVNELMTGIVHFALAIAPYAVPAMIYSAIVKIGWDIVVALGVFVAGCVFVLLLHLFGTMSLWLKFLAKRNPLET